MIIRFYQKNRKRNMRKLTLKAFYANRGEFLKKRAEARRVIAENIAKKWDTRIQSLFR